VKILLLEPGKQLLGNLLRDPKFKFDGQIGKPAANVLLDVMRSQAADPVGSPAAVESIHSYEVFKTIALETFDRLNQDFNMDNLVPIYRIRRVIGARVSRKDFDSWLLELQATDIFQLLEGSVEDSAPDKIEDSISTKVSGLRCYAKRLEA
jgi:predicted  nucleic acid-binding Zn ribbon protein